MIANLKQEFEVSAARQSELEGGLANLKAEISTTKTHQARLRQLSREVKTTRELYEALLSRSKQTSATAGLQVPDARLLERADVPLRPVGPKRKKLLALILVAAMIFAATLALMLEFLQKGFTQPDEIERILQHETIAAFPRSSLGSKRDAVWQSARQIVTEPMSPFAESTRQLRHEIDVDWSAATPRLIMTASALAEEGRSLIAANLAYCYALAGHSTVLVDGDLRFGSLSRSLGISGRPGLLNALANEINPLDCLLVEPSVNLNFMPAMNAERPSVPAPELLAGSQFAETIDALKQEFSVIIIDAPPLLPIVDGRTIGAVADQIVFVTTWRKTPKELSRRALQSLGHSQEKVAGIVVNHVERGDFERHYNHPSQPKSTRSKAAA